MTSRSLHRLLLATTTAVAVLGVGAAGPASADVSGSTTVGFSVTGGALSVSTPDSAGVTVTDARNALAAAWQTSVSRAAGDQGGPATVTFSVV